MPDISADIVIESPLWPDEEILRKFVGKTKFMLEGIGKGHIAFVFSDDSMVHVLNREWRGKDKPTNVLSFPDGDEEDGVVHLGDVILAHETITRESVELGIAFDDHLTHLLLHGSLHLLGYDHEEEGQAQAMESLETRLLAGIGIKDPYQVAPGSLD